MWMGFLVWGLGECGFGCVLNAGIAFCRFVVVWGIQVGVAGVLRFGVVSEWLVFGVFWLGDLVCAFDYVG